MSAYIDDNAVDLMFLTETWLRSYEDEVKIANLAPPSGYAVKSFSRPSRGGWNRCHLQDQPLFSPHWVV